jgi:hypothetical protein
MVFSFHFLSVVWDCEVAAICLLLHLLPPTSKGKKSAKISATDATVRLVKFLKVCSYNCV